MRLPAAEPAPESRRACLLRRVRFTDSGFDLNGSQLKDTSSGSLHVSEQSSESPGHRRQALGLIVAKPPCRFPLIFHVQRNTTGGGFLGFFDPLST